MSTYNSMIIFGIAMISLLQSSYATLPTHPNAARQGIDLQPMDHAVPNPVPRLREVLQRLDELLGTQMTRTFNRHAPQGNEVDGDQVELAVNQATNPVAADLEQRELRIRARNVRTQVNGPITAYIHEYNGYHLANINVPGFLGLNALNDAVQHAQIRVVTPTVGAGKGKKRAPSPEPDDTTPANKKPQSLKIGGSRSPSGTGR